MVRTRVGYTGGTTKDPTYRSLGDHTETVQLEYDPTKTDYKTLLNMFWGFHDPTACHKRQYMSAIFYHDKEQKAAAEESLKQYQNKLGKQVATKILAAGTFYDAEDYHQKYLLRRNAALCESLKKAGLKNFKESHVAARLNGYCCGGGSLANFEAEHQKLGLTDVQAVLVRQCMKS